MDSEKPTIGEQAVRTLAELGQLGKVRASELRDGSFQLLFEQQKREYALAARRGNIRSFRLETMVRFLRELGVHSLTIDLLADETARRR